MTVLDRASNQWRTRPPDQRFPSIEALRTRAHQYANAAHEEVVRMRDLNVDMTESEILLNGTPMTNWAFSQLSKRIGAPAAYIRKLPTETAHACVRHGMTELLANEPESTSVILSHSKAIQGMTTERYVRIWNAEIADSLCELQAQQPWWEFPTSFKKAGSDKVENAWGEQRELPVAFLSDRDMFVFLCDYSHPIKNPGSDDALTRGFWVENSEVGKGAVKITCFLFDFVCSNVLVWGAKNVVEVKVNHIGRARERVLLDSGEVQQAVYNYANSLASNDERRIVQAKNLLLGDTREEVMDWAYGLKIPGITRTVLERAAVIAERTPRYGDPRSAWALVNGLTETSQTSDHAEDRIAIDKAAGKILDLTVPLET